MDTPPIDDGGLLVVGGRIAAVGRYRDLSPHHSGEQIDLGAVILMPGLINSHCHLALSSLRNLLLNPTTFTKWIQRINATKRNLTDDDYLNATIAGAAELLRHGTTSVVNIESFPELLDRHPKLPLRTWWCYEMLDIRLRLHTEASMRGAMSFFEPGDSEMTHFALSPHAPYTATAGLYRLAAAAARETGLLVTTHLAESGEEMQMLRDASGPLYDFLQNLGRDMSDCGQATPFQHLVENGSLQPEDLLVHLNELSRSDYELIARWSQGRSIHVAHCPKSHEFFRHNPFPYHELIAVNANISLGTDSLASNDQLNLFAEMRCFAEHFPDVAPVEIVEMVTRNPALTLKKSAEMGIFRPNAWADAIAVPADDISIDKVYETIVENRGIIPWIMVAGNVVTL